MNNIDERKDLLKKLEPILGSRAKALWYMTLFSEDPKTEYKNKELLRLIADKNAKHDFKDAIRLPPPSPAKLPGRFYLGQVLYPDSFYSDYGLNENDFIKHIFIAGMTGTGKTNLSFQILKQLVKNKKPFLVFDWKGSYRALKHLPGFTDLKVIRLGNKDCNFKFNPLIPPPKVHPKHWMSLLVDVMNSSFFGSYGVEYFLRKGIHHIYNQYGIYRGKQKYPNFFDLAKTMKKEFARGREALWMSTVKRMLAVLIHPSLLSKIVNTRKYQPLDKLLKQKIIFEMDNLSTIEKIFFIESFLLWIYNFRKYEGKKSKFKHAIIIEEAHHILSGKSETKQGEENIIETIIRMIREFGESIITIDQEPSKISSSILANTSCKICFNLGNGKDIEIMAKAMSLNKDEMRSIDKLRIGHAIVKMKHRFHEPINVKFPLIKIQKTKSKNENIDPNKLNKNMFEN